jgi:sugar lactone lactonase YvrE
MGDSLSTTVVQFSSSGGRTQARAANVRAVEPAANLPGSERGNLYLLIEVTGSGGSHAALYRQMLSAAQAAFYEASGGQSAALIRAVRAAHSVLARANEALPEADWRAGMSCAVMQGSDLIIAQAGPALIMMGHPKTIDQYPAQAGPAGVALGGPERPEVELYRTTVEPGGMLMLAQSDWLTTVPPEALAAVAAAENPRLASDYLTQLAGDADLSALLVAFSLAIPEVRDEAFGGPVILPDGLSRPPAPVAAPPAVTFDAPPPTLRPAAPAEFVPPADAPPRRGLLDRFARGPREPIQPREQPVEPELAAPEPIKPVREETGRRSPWGLLLALIVIPLVVVALVVAMLWFRTRTADAEFKQTLTGAETAITEARGLSDEAAARLRLGNARDFLDKARATRPDDAQLAKLQADYSEVLGRVNRITPLYGLMPLWQFRETGRKLNRILLGGDSLFVLDIGKGEVVRFTLSKLGDSVTPANPDVVIRKGQAVGNAAISDLVDADWAAAVGNQRSRVLALDTAGGLLSYDVTWGATRIPLAGREKLGLPQLVKSYGGNLYVVDTKAGQLWRYRPTEKGYEGQPEPYFAVATKVDLSGVQSVEIDGNVWVLFADGRLLKFFGGEQKPFELKGLPDPLSAPTAVVSQLDGDLLYIADSGNGRILEFTKEGQFQRQFRPAQGNDLQGMRDIFLDEAGDKLYILTADKLFKADVPRLPPGVKPAPGQ